MRLIDAELFVAISWKAHKDETYKQGFEDGVCYVLDRIEQAPTVDAIPVEWLRNFAKERFEKPVLDLLWYWQKEQEEMKDAAD